MARKNIIKGSIANRPLSREPGFTPEDLMKDEMKAMQKISKVTSKAAVKKAKVIAKLGA